MLGPDRGGGDIVLGVVRPWLLELTAAMAAEVPRTREVPCGEHGFADARTGTGPSRSAGAGDVRSGAGPAGAARSEDAGLAPAGRSAGTLAPT